MLEYLQKPRATVSLSSLLPNHKCSIANFGLLDYTAEEDLRCLYILFILFQLMSMDLPYFEKFSLKSSCSVSD